MFKDEFISAENTHAARQKYMKGQRSNLCLGESKIARRRSQIEKEGRSGDRTLALASEHQEWFLGISRTRMHMGRLA